jgi:peptidyl-prolyl cis-trans isomerase SurA
MFRSLLLIFPILLLISPNADGQKKPGSSVVFSVDNKAVTVDEFVYLYKKNHQLKQPEYTKEKMKEYLDLFVNFKLKVAEARRRGIDTTAAFRKEYNTYRDELRKPYLPDARLVDSLVALTYDRMKEEVNASHILLAVPADASSADEQAVLTKIKALRERALKGENFDGLAVTYSEDPSAKVNKGNLGYFTALQMVYPFEQAAYATPEGSVSEPVRTSFGYHILKVNDRRPSSGEVEVSHILLRTGENKDNDAAKNQIFDLYDQLQNGASWAELCRQFSEDPSSKDNGGKLRPFGVGVMPGVPDFERMAFELQKPGQISDPFQTQYGWHIIKLERKLPLGSFEELKASIKNRVTRDDRVQVSRSELYQRLRAANGFKENASIRDLLINAADTTLQKGKWIVPGQVMEKKNDVVFSIQGKSFLVSDFLHYVKEHQKRSMTLPRLYMAELLNAFADDRLLELIESNIMANNPEYRWLLNEYYEGILLFDIMEKEVWNKASSDSLGQVNFFTKRANAYMADERVDAVIYSSNDHNVLEQWKKALGGDSNLLKELNASGNRSVKIDSGRFEKADRIILSKIPWSVGLHTGENNNLHYLVDVKKLLAPGPKTFEEARADVISDYQAFLEKEWLVKLRKDHSVTINKKGQDAAFKILAEEKTE